MLALTVCFLSIFVSYAIATECLHREHVRRIGEIYERTRTELRAIHRSHIEANSASYERCLKALCADHEARLATACDECERQIAETTTPTRGPGCAEQ